MLTNSLVYPTIPAVDIKRARKFYEDKLGLKVMMEDPSPGIMFKVGDCMVYVYQTAMTKAEHTVAAFGVNNIEAEMKELRGKGVMFEEYDMPGMKTVNGVATFKMPPGELRAAWFKDSEGNILGLVEMSKALKDEAMAQMSGMKM